MEARLPGVTPWPDEFAERYRSAGYWRGDTFGQVLRVRATQHPDRVAVVDGERRITYGGLDQRADRLAAGLRERGIGKGDRVVVQLPNVLEFFEVCFGLFRLGAVPVFALPSHRKTEISYFCEFSDAAAYITVDLEAGFDHRKLAAEVTAQRDDLQVFVVGGPGEFTALSEVDADPVELDEPLAGDIAFLQLSGGSTGVPKLIPRTHDDYIYSFRASNDICGVTEQTVYLVALPAAHNFPMSSPGTFGVLHAGGRVVLARRPSPDEVFPLVERESVTLTAAVPPLALLWLDAAAETEHDLSSLQVLQVGGAKCSEEVARRVRPVLGATLQQVFGMAEGLVNYTRLDDPEDVIVSTQGRPISPDDEVLVVDDEDNPVPPGESGHLLTRGPYTIRGYYKAEEHNARAFTPEGFYRTGDVVRLTAEGNVVVEGRAKDQINRGGEKVAAEEVENHLLAHPAVHDAAVVSMPDDYLGERTCAFVIPRGTAPPGRELIKFVRGRGLAGYKVPDRVVFVEQFPQTGVGKVSKRDLREAISRELVPKLGR
ncbi:(2,3-dihydroxybenzoyl)adenylate synthase [Saccharopolyspora rhizosphaerae]|uniref:(2,3-dihydroxybenzoyl)adenylate synthase n=1 Tax=Saccharopolyspora rhizosphaerae TaxID=2492662 RepID=A0A426K0L3_9PSEU|nr:(2,3-dihydroxybenzoyl)adenylate synthase [Saccharopolyspora rhizosphaerae]RRO18939.1 (2,3-dihydroxybenzoyl)adenylate synthase [Saccharopolyspora rhizosphaerae]